MEQQPQKPTQSHKPVYPDGALSEKQLEALQKVIGPSVEQTGGQTRSKKKASQNQAELKIKDRSVVKNVFLAIFMILTLTAAAAAGWYYWWTNHATFEYTLQAVAILDGQSIMPGDFLTPEDELEGISAAYRDIDFEPAVGMQFVPLTLTLGLRTLETASVLYILTPVESYQHEFTESGTVLRPVDFLENADIVTNVSVSIRFTEEPLPLEEYPVGEYPLFLSFNDAPFEVVLTVVDTTPPVVITEDKEILIGEDVAPEDFVAEIHDPSPPFTIDFHTVPDVFAAYDQTVEVVVADAFGNSAFSSALLSILLNTAPPVLEGVEEVIESKVDTPVPYDRGVTAHDDFGRELEVQVKNDGVDEGTIGTYSAVYWAEDLTGLYSEVEVTVHIISVDPEEVTKIIDDLLASILKDGMTQSEKVVAIHNWVRWNVGKTTTGSGSQSITEEAYRALRGERKGDAHGYASVSSLMLTRAGIPNMRIERIDTAEIRHHWLLVNPDELGWHHYDPYPTSLVLGELTSMFTDAQAKGIAKRVKDHIGTEDYYTYDTEQYPEVVKE